MRILTLENTAYEMNDIPDEVDVWLSAEEAKKYGIADKIVEVY
jgi:ATP-dependent protease ClpP protease subunit